MTPWRGRGRGPNRGGGARAVASAVRNQNHRDNGYTFRPPQVPPPFATHPWNAFTYSVTYDGTGGNINVTTAQLTAYLRNKVGLEATAEVPIKIEKAGVWATTKGATMPYPILTAQFYELQASGASALQNARKDVRDHGSMTTPAKAGFFWPLQDRREVISDSQNLTVLQFRGDTGNACTVQIHFLWRAFGAGSGDSQVVTADVEEI